MVRLLRFTNNWFRHSLSPYQHRTCCSGMTFIITLEPYRRFVQIHCSPLLTGKKKKKFTFAVCPASDGTLHCPKPPRISNFIIINVLSHPRVLRFVFLPQNCFAFHDYQLISSSCSVHFYLFHFLQGKKKILREISSPQLLDTRIDLKL